MRFVGLFLKATMEDDSFSPEELSIARSVMRELWMRRTPEQEAADKAWQEENARWNALTSKERAQAVLDHYLRISELLDPSDVDAIEAEFLAFDETIKRGLDSASLMDFMALLEASFARDRAMVNAATRHAEHRAMKADVFAWLDSNMRRFKSMDAAAEAIAGKICPITFRTARSWVGQWKKLRSASTP